MLPYITAALLIEWHYAQVHVYPTFFSISGNNENAYGVLPVAFHQNLCGSSSDKNIWTDRPDWPYMY
jgi:hypothetical protein